MFGVYIWYAALWQAWADSLTPLTPKPPGLEEGVRLEHEHEHVRASEYFPHLARGPDYPKQRPLSPKQVEKLRANYIRTQT